MNPIDTKMTQKPNLDLAALRMSSNGEIPEGLIRWTPRLTDEEKALRFGTALHEAAHFVASCACPRSTILNVFIHPTGRSTKAYAGRVQSAEILEEEELFVTYAGIAWERFRGEEWRARSDIDSIRHSTVADRSAVEYAACCFVADNAMVIWAVAVGFLAQCRADGTLDGPRLKCIEHWARQQVAHFFFQRSQADCEGVRSFCFYP